MKIYLGLLDNSPPDQTRVFGEIDGKLIDLSLAHAAFLTETTEQENAYEVAAFYFPPTIVAFLERGEKSLKALEQVLSLVGQRGAENFRGPRGEKVVYNPNEIRILPPLEHPEKSIVIGFADRARVEAMPKTEIPTGFYKLPQTFITSGAPIVWPKFSEEVDADACLAIVIGKAGRKIAPEQAWQHVAGATLVIDITARDVNRRKAQRRIIYWARTFLRALPLVRQCCLQSPEKSWRAWRPPYSSTGSCSKGSPCATLFLASNKSSPAGRSWGSSPATGSPSAPAWRWKATGCKIRCR
jgi:2-keto-4-pentenoate hydratase/2-oxohepta-3-ene-1,7-dioic acid hydratase in catechol pathway